MNGIAMRLPRIVALMLIGVVGPLPTLAASDAPQVAVLKIDLAPRIEASSRYRERFAVDVPHAATASGDGAWSREGGFDVWRYAVRIPGAVSMSFHAGRVRFTGGTTLAVEGGGKRVTYPAPSMRDGEIWSHVFRGDTLAFTLSVPTRDASATTFEIASLQAGYRGLGGGVADHPAFKRAKGAATAASVACDENYDCHSNAANQGPGDATTAILIGNIAQCTATLLNNVRGDATPYLLTARHCQSGQSNPASSVTPFWDAVSACAGSLGTIYDSTATIEMGGTTFVEQQDMWLIRLHSPPRSANAYYAGWDATGGSIVGGYSIHHAQGRDKQYTGWFGQSVLIQLPGSVIEEGYDSGYWGVLNEIGRIGGGASGGALFDPSHRVTGVASLAFLEAGDGSAGFCPLTPVPAPTPENVTALYNAISELWNSTADTTSSTNPATLQSILDPDDAGQRVVDGFAYLAGAQLAGDQFQRSTGELLRLTWTAPGATSCTASGGTPGDGWAGPRAASGSVEVTQYTGGDVQYMIKCPAGDRLAIASTTATWVELPPNVFLAAESSVIVGQTFDLLWRSNVEPCTASGGIPGDGWAGGRAPRGTLTIAATDTGSFTYSMTCGAGTRTATQSLTMVVQPPQAGLTTDATRIRIGQPVNLRWFGLTTCTASGGAPGDGWAGALGAALKTVTTSTPGTYTYTVTCTGGAFSASASVDVTYTADAPMATLVADPTSQEVPPLGSGGPFSSNLTWTSNVRPCELSVTGPGINPGTVRLEGDFPGGTALDLREVAGLFTYTLRCGSGTQTAEATATIDWLTTQPYVDLQVPFQMNLNQSFVFNWNSNVFPCTGGGGVAGDGWVGPKATAWGSQPVGGQDVPGTYTYTLTCGSGAQTVQTQKTVTVLQAAVTLSAPPMSRRFTGDNVNLSWSATTSPCIASSSPASNTWTGSHGHSGSFNVTEPTAGTYTYIITCGTSPHTAQASVQVTYETRPPPTVWLTASPPTPNVGQGVTLTWMSDNATSCTATGGLPNPGWNGTSLVLSGSALVTSFSAGTIVYGINCSGAVAEVQVEYRPVPTGGDEPPGPSVTLSSNLSSQIVQQSVTLTWDARNAAACTAGGGSAADGWTGSLSMSGSRSVSESTPGQYQYEITCSGAPPAATALVTVTFNAAPPPPGGGGGGGGGGGAMDPSLLLLLALLFVGLRGRSST